MKNYRYIICGCILAGLLLSGCAPNADAIGPAGATSPNIENIQAVELPIPDNTNEAGRIPILMYHRIMDSKSEYDRTAEMFRNDLELLYQEGYRPISLKDFVAGRVDVPAGYSPVVITFDDGDRTQYTASGEGVTPTDDCALGIMELFRADHPDFNPQATFFVNGGVPFGQKSLLKEKLNYLVSKGYTIGNHTWNHEKLSVLTPDRIQETLGKNAAALQAITCETVDLLALPYGIRPKEQAPMDSVIAGTFEGTEYRNAGICNVGWQPELPAYMEGFDPFAINRIRCGDDQDEAGYWLAQMKKNPESRYISDGDPDTVTVSAEKSSLVKETVLGKMTLRIIDEEDFR